MNNLKKIKISGRTIKSLISALYLAKCKCNIYIDNLIDQYDLKNNKEKIYTITNDLKAILKDLELWEEIKQKIYYFDSISFFNYILKEEISFSFSKYFLKDNTFANVYGCLNHSDLYQVIVNKILKVNNIFTTNIEDHHNINYQLDLNFGEFNNFNINPIKNLFHKNVVPHSALVFKLFIRGNIDRRVYEIFLKDELILMLPLSKSIYHIIWTANDLMTNYRFNLNENLLLDNISAILPNGFMVDQLVGDIHYSKKYSYSSKSVRFYNNKIYFNDIDELSNHLISNELNNLLFELSFLKDSFKSKNKFNINSFNKIKTLIQRKYFYKIISYSTIKTFLFNIFIRIKIFPRLLKKSLIFKVNNFFFVKTFIKDIIFKSILISLIKK